jgi:beta-galactosidase
MNTWGWGQPPMYRTPEGKKGASYRLYRTSFTPRKNLADGTGQIHFYKIIGKAEIWLDGVLIGKKKTFAPTGLNLPLPAGTGKHQLNVIIQGDGDNKAGVEGNVVIEPKQ